MKNTMIAALSFLLISSTVMGQDSVDSSFTTSGKALTDAQATEALNFVHQGKEDAAIKKGCADKDLDNCNPSPQEKGVLLGGGIGAALENNISKLYTVFFGGMGFLTGGGGPKVNAKVAKPDPAVKPEANAPKADKKKKTDYCMYGAMAGEFLAQAMQKAGQNSVQQGTANLDPQVAALVSLKETHNTRKKTASLQAGVYTGVTACYVAQAAIGGVALDAGYILRMGAAAGIAMLYKAKADKEANSAKKVQAVIDSLPKAGDCNPYTGTACFCNEKTSATLYASQYQEVCVLNKGNADGTLASAGCAAVNNGAVSYDASCSCKSTKTCVSGALLTYNPSLAQGANWASQANKGFDLLSGKPFDTAAIGSFTTATNAAFNKLKDKLNTSNVPIPNLTDDQKKNAAALSEFMPSAVAANVASAQGGSPSSGGLMNHDSNAALAKIPDSFKKKLQAEVSGGYSSKGGSGNANTAPEEAAFTFPKAGGEESSGDGSEVVSFAQRAVEGADFTKDAQTPIFDIISNRYRSSGWNKVQIEPVATP